MIEVKLGKRIDWKGFEKFERVLGRIEEENREKYFVVLKERLFEYIKGEMKNEIGLVRFREAKIGYRRQITARWIRKVRSLMTEFFMREERIGIEELIEEMRYLVFYGRRRGDNKDRFQYREYETFYKKRITVKNSNRIDLKGRRRGNMVYWLITNELEFDIALRTLISEFIEWKLYNSSIYTVDYIGILDSNYKEYLRYLNTKVKEREKEKGTGNINVKTLTSLEYSYDYETKNEREWDILAILSEIDYLKSKGEYYRHLVRYLERYIRNRIQRKIEYAGNKVRPYWNAFDEDFEENVIVI